MVRWVKESLFPASGLFASLRLDTPAPRVFKNGPAPLPVVLFPPLAIPSPHRVSPLWTPPGHRHPRPRERPAPLIPHHTPPRFESHRVLFPENNQILHLNPRNPDYSMGFLELFLFAVTFSYSPAIAYPIRTNNIFLCG